MRFVKLLALAATVAIGVSGCTIPQKYRLAASELGPVPTAPDGTPLPGIQAAHIMVQDSETKCAAFVNSMFAENASTGLILDILNTGSSALATVFTPLSTVHALTASSTIFGGARTSITAEYLNSLSVSHVVQAIQSTYSADMQKYIAYLNSSDPNRIDAYAERSTILSCHNECSLASAEGSISTALQPGQTSPQSSQPIVYPVAANDTPPSIASALSSAINQDPNFRAAGVTASPQGSSIALKATKAAKVTATVSPADHTENVSPSALSLTANGSGTLSISGTPRAKDTITVQVESPQPAGTAAPATVPPPAAILGKAPSGAK